MTDVSIASAVAMPEEVARDESPRPNGLKRRQPEIAEDEQENKRQRVSPGKNSPAVTRDDPNSNPSGKAGEPDPKPSDLREARRKSSIADEKQRSKRLFGALLGSLNQPSDRTSKRRQEIESRRKAELQQQDDERLEDKLRRQEKLAEQRKKAQVKVDEEHMRTRHSNMLNTANFLQTESEPKIYYRPWDLRPDEEDRIEDQLKQAQTQIDRELGKTNDTNGQSSTSEARDDPKELPTEDTSARPHLDVEPAAVPVEETSTGDDSKTVDADNRASAKSANNEDSKPAEVPDSDRTNSDTNAASPKPQDKTEVEEDGGKEQEAEDDGEHVVEGDEDTVIY